VTCIPKQPLSFAPSSTSLCFLRALSGSTGWRWPVSWSTLGSLQLVGLLVVPRRYTRRILTEQSDTRRGILRHRACCSVLAGIGFSSMSLHRRAFHHRPLSTDVSQPLWSKSKTVDKGSSCEVGQPYPTTPPSVNGTHRRCWRGTAWDPAPGGPRPCRPWR
jgi:hypothetical protein